MFTGIIESVGSLKEIKEEGTNISFKVASDISHELKIDQSISHNGVCLTVTALEDGAHWVTAVEETLIKSNLGALKSGDELNLERCMVMNGRLDGHIVQGHVDGMGKVLNVEDKDGSWVCTFSYERSAEHLLVEKGSVTINGISLTVFDVKADQFCVTIIPYTWDHTNMHGIKIGAFVNLEFDIIGKYVAAMADYKASIK